MCRRHAEHRGGIEEFVVISEQDAEFRVANPYRILQHGLEYRLQLAGRAGDDTQHLGCRGLLVERFTEIIGALPQFVEQPRVLDGDDRLGGEIADKIDLLVGKRVNILMVDGDRADQFIVAEHGDGERGTRAGHLCQHRFGVAFIGGKIVDVDDFLCRDEGADDRIHRHRPGPRAAPLRMRAARYASPSCAYRARRTATGCRTGRRRCASRWPAWPRTPAPARRATS